MSLIVILGAIFYIQPRSMSTFGLDLLLRLAVPLALATLAQMFIMTVNDLDLSIGAYVGVTAGIGATLLVEQPLLGVLALVGCVVGLRRPGRAHPRAQPAVDRGHAGHVLRVAGCRHHAAAHARVARPPSGCARS